LSTRIAIIDIDGVVADATTRFAKAEEVKQRYIEELQQELGVTDERGATDTYWQTVFSPEHVPLDTLIDGAIEALDTLQFTHGYHILFLTSRPEAMRDATAEWLYYHKANFYRKVLSDERRLIMKAPAFQYVKTVVWKAGMVQTLAALYGASDVLIVEDEQVNINEHLKYVSSEVQTRQIYTSLKEAVEAMQEEVS